MPIGTSKVGLFGGRIPIPAGSQTFNSPGTFVVPEGLEIVTVSGNGSSGNPGNPGGAGTGGCSGAGGSAGTLYNACPIAPNQNWNYNPGLDVKPGGASRQAPGGPGLSGNPGNAGATTSALGQTFTNGNGGTGGNAGNPGASGNPGNAGNSSNIARAGPPGSACSPTDFGGSGGSSNVPPLNTGGTGMKGRAQSTDNPPPISIQMIEVFGGHGGSGAGSSSPGQYLIGGCMPAPGTTTSSTSPIPGGATGGGAAGLGVYANGGPSFCQYSTPRSPTAGSQGNTTTGFAGGGGGGGGGARMAANNAGGWAGQVTSGGGGGGSSTSGNPGNAGNPGNSGTPATFNCVPTTTGSYPVQVGSGGQITISWNTQ